MTSDPDKSHVENILSGLGDIVPSLEDVYKDLHSHPELSMQEHRMANIATRDTSRSTATKSRLE